MAAIDEIKKMKTQGQNESQMINTLQEKGVSPREINDALAQSKIKEAVTGMPMQNQPGGYQESNMQPGMQPSISNQNQAPSPLPDQQGVQPQPQEGPYAQEYQDQGYETQGRDQYDDQGYETQGYDDQGYDNQRYSSYGANTDTISEIASQIVSEKMKKTNKILNDVAEAKVLLTSKVEKMDERLDRIEKIIDQLQMSVLRKASAQEDNIGDIKNEMEKMQEGFSKVLNPLMDLERPKRKKSTRKKKRK